MWNLKYDTKELIYKTVIDRHGKQTYVYQRGKGVGEERGRAEERKGKRESRREQRREGKREERRVGNQSL